MKVRDVMTATPICSAPDTPIPELARLMAEHDCGGIPIVDGAATRPVGFVTDRDIGGADNAIHRRRYALHVVPCNLVVRQLIWKSTRIGQSKSPVNFVEVFLTATHMAWQSVVSSAK